MKYVNGITIKSNLSNPNGISIISRRYIVILFLIELFHGTGYSSTTPDSRLTGSSGGVSNNDLVRELEPVAIEYVRHDMLLQKHTYLS